MSVSQQVLEPQCFSDKPQSLQDQTRYIQTPWQVQRLGLLRCRGSKVHTAHRFVLLLCGTNLAKFFQVLVECFKSFIFKVPIHACIHAYTIHYYLVFSCPKVPQFVLRSKYSHVAGGSTAFNILFIQYC